MLSPLNKPSTANNGANYPQSAASSFIAGDIIHSTSLDNDHTNETSDSDDLDNISNRKDHERIHDNGNHNRVERDLSAPTMDTDIDMDTQHHHLGQDQNFASSDSENDPIF